MAPSSSSPPSPASRSSLLLAMLLLLILMSSAADADHRHQGREVYIVYMGEKPPGHTTSFSVVSLHRQLLDQVLVNCTSEESIVHSYTRSFNGFAAKLTYQEQEKLAGMEGIVSVFRSRTLTLQTTRSWDFLGLLAAEEANIVGGVGTAAGYDVIVGMIDSGIWPESESFNDKGLAPSPPRWKGICQNITCNNKIIGARYYHSSSDYPIGPDDELSPRDTLGHGTHTSSTAAGRAVADTGFYGIANGTARGGAPSARLAAYKVCWNGGSCGGAAILAAFDDAIADGVDVISISIGGSSAADYLNDPIAIGSLHAVKKGIVTSAAAGNSGPYLASVSNVAPWQISVAASTTDRRIGGKVALGNNALLQGASINTFATENKSYPLKMISGGGTGDNSMNGSIVVYNRGLVIHLSGGARGAVSVSDGGSGGTPIFSYPGVLIGTAQADLLYNYMNHTKNPVANIHKSESEIDPNVAPSVAEFSSRGPNIITPYILKPDISAPGVDILAAWSLKAAVSNDPQDTRSTQYKFESGTSMACPHASGVAAYVKSIHPDWSPAAIMSAIITTATPAMNESANQGGAFAYGSGQLNPSKAPNPGLIYNVTTNDYINILCNKTTNSNPKTIQLIAGDDDYDNTTCSSAPNNSMPAAVVANGGITTREINYPSMAFLAKADTKVEVEFKRTVTNVGRPASVYSSNIVVSGAGAAAVTISVAPTTLSFASMGEKLEFVVAVSAPAMPAGSYVSAALHWSDGEHQVRSPIVIYTASDD